MILSKMYMFNSLIYIYLQAVKAKNFIFWSLEKNPTVVEPFQSVGLKSFYNGIRVSYKRANTKIVLKLPLLKLKIRIYRNSCLSSSHRISREKCLGLC